MTLNLNQIGSSNEIIKLILKSFNDKQPKIAEYIINNLKKRIKNVNETDIYNRNILHYLVIYGSNLTFSNLLKELLMKNLNNLIINIMLENLKKVINLISNIFYNLLNI